MKTKVFFDTFKGHKMFAVWEVDDDDNKVGQYPLFSLGTKKCKALAEHLQEFKEFVELANNEENKRNR